MRKREIMAALEEMALLLELKGESPFKSRAYRNAARTLHGVDADLSDLVRRGELSSLKGFGKALTEKVTTMVQTGSLPQLERLREEARSP